MTTAATTAGTRKQDVQIRRAVQPAAAATGSARIRIISTGPSAGSRSSTAAGRSARSDRSATGTVRTSAPGIAPVTTEAVRGSTTTAAGYNTEGAPCAASARICC